MRAKSALFAFLVLILSGTAVLAQDTANVRITNLSPDIGEVSVWINGELERQFLGFERTTEYLPVTPGAHTVEIRDAFDESVTFLSQSLNLLAGQRFTLGITGVQSLNDLQFVTLEDDSTTDLRSARVRFVHSTPNMPAVDIAIAGAGGQVLIENLGYRQNSGYISVRPDVYSLEVRVAGTSEVLYTIEDMGMSRLTACTIFTITEGESGVIETVHTFEANISINYQEILLGLSLWAALLAWFVQNHAN